MKNRDKLVSVRSVNNSQRQKMTHILPNSEISHEELKKLLQDHIFKNDKVKKRDVSAQTDHILFMALSSNPPDITFSGDYNIRFVHR